MSWFAVDREGLAKIAGRRGKVFVLHELLQNAWDCSGAREVSVGLAAISGRPLATLVVEDDDPDGFRDLTHSYTLFAESEKKAKRDKRGRFNLGEKLVLALCEEAEIISTTGGVRFDKDGRHQLRRRRERGTQFMATIRITRGELEEVAQAIRLVIPPDNVRTTFNGTPIPTRQPVAVAEQVLLMTETVGEDGVMHRPYEYATVRIYRPEAGEKPHLYEMGIPVMELPDDPYHVSIEQKVPLSMERDAVTPYYLREVRTAVLGATAHLLDATTAADNWVSDAITATDVNPAAVRAVIEKRFGPRAVIADPSDREAENRAKGSGYQVVTGGAFSAQAWEQVRQHGGILPAGQVMPTPRPFTPGAPPLKLIPRGDWWAGMFRCEAIAEALAAEVGIDGLKVAYADDAGWPFAGTYNRTSRSLIINAGKVGSGFFDDRKAQLELLIHELAHHWGDHLEEAFDDALARIGAAAVALALRTPALFDTGSLRAGAAGFGYPAGWPRCPGCGSPALDGKVTCGDAACGPSAGGGR